MRALSFLLLLATAAAPALAQSEDSRGGRHHRGDSAEQSETRPQRASDSRRSVQNSSPAQRSLSSSGNQQSARELMREHVLQQRLQSTSTQPDSNLDVRTVRRAQRDTADTQSSAQPSSGWRPRERQIRTIPDTQSTATRSSTAQREGFQGRTHRDYRNGDYTRWSNNWRYDRRYDWRRYRDHHRSNFRLGFYYDPFGWNYRRWSIGSHLYPSYYGSSFWLNDPWQYRLPPAYGPYRWVRYWNDALLVNIYTGQVVDVIHGFFW